MTIKAHKNQRGSVALITCILLLVLISFTIVNLARSVRGGDRMHSSQKEFFYNEQGFEALALQFDRFYTMGTSDPSCSSFGSSFRRLRINGRTLCLPNGNKICVSLPLKNNRGVDKKACASTQRAHLIVNSSDPSIQRLNRTRSNSLTVARFGDASKETSLRFSSRETRITVPQNSNALWKKCNGSALCLRLYLCHERTRTCRPNNALGSQVVSLTAFD